MKTTLLTPSFVLLAATASVIAAPSPAPILGEIKSNTKHHFSPGKECGEPKHFTSAFTVRATPDQIVTNDGSKPAGQPDAVGRYQFVSRFAPDVDHRTRTTPC